MNRKSRHGRALTSYEETVMDLMIRVEKSEQYLQRYRNNDSAVIVVENGEEEHYPSFAIGKKKKEEAVQSIKSIRQEEEETEGIDRYEGTEVITVKLTVWEWMEARRKGIVNVLLLSAAFFLQIYIVWTDMNAVSSLILRTMKNACIVALIWKFGRWVISGEMHSFLNEDS